MQVPLAALVGEAERPAAPRNIAAPDPAAATATDASGRHETARTKRHIHRTGARVEP